MDRNQVTVSPIERQGTLGLVSINKVNLRRPG